MTTLLLAAAAGLLTACGPSSAAAPAQPTSPDSPPATASSTPSATASSTPPAPTPSSRLPEQPPAQDADVTAPPCEPANVEAVIAGDAIGTADVARTPIILANTGDACELTGYSKIEFLNADTGRPMGVAEYGSGAPRPVVVRHGHKAWFDIHYPTPPDGTGEACLAGSVLKVRVTLPGNTGTVDVAYKNEEFALPPVCGHVTVAPWAMGGVPS